MKQVALLVMLIAVFMLQGCTGVVTGHQYTVGDAKIIYKVVKGGVTTFMTHEQIQDAGLDKLDDVVIKSYKAVE